LPAEIAHFGGSYFKTVSYGEAWTLFVFAVFFGAGACGIVKAEAMYGKHDLFERYVDFIKMTLVMSMAWNLLFCAEWNMVLVFGEHVLDRVVLKHVILALVISYFSMATILLLDLVANKLKSPILKKAGRLLGKGFGLSVAFAWEITFDVSVDTLADSEDFNISGPAMKFAMASFLIGMVAPAWAKYVLPMAMQEAPRMSFQDGVKPDPEQSETSEDTSTERQTSGGKLADASVQTKISDVTGLVNWNGSDEDFDRPVIPIADVERLNVTTCDPAWQTSDYPTSPKVDILV
jgi:hypothetical protein